MLLLAFQTVLQQQRVANTSAIWSDAASSAAVAVLVAATAAEVQAGQIGTGSAAVAIAASASPIRAAAQTSAGSAAVAITANAVLQADNELDTASGTVTGGAGGGGDPAGAYNETRHRAFIDRIGFLKLP